MTSTYIYISLNNFNFYYISYVNRFNFSKNEENRSSKRVPYYHITTTALAYINEILGDGAITAGC